MHTRSYTHTHAHTHTHTHTHTQHTHGYTIHTQIRTHIYTCKAAHMISRIHTTMVLQNDIIMFASYQLLPIASVGCRVIYV